MRKKKFKIFKMDFMILKIELNFVKFYMECKMIQELFKNKWTICFFKLNNVLPNQIQNE